MGYTRDSVIKRTCQTCGSIFEAWPYAVKNGHANFCSRTCHYLVSGYSRTTLAIAMRTPTKYFKSHAIIPVGRRDYMKVSLEDVDFMTRFYWHKTFDYAVAKIDGKTTRAHRVIMGRMLGLTLDSNQLVDHINRDTKDNRRNNLRLATESQNAVNKVKRVKTSSPYRGVSFCKDTGRWRMCVGGKATTGNQIKFGRYKDPEEAAWMYDQFASQIFGEFAILNFDYDKAVSPLTSR